jgi:predicted component of type VI protein secretion system
MQVVLVMFRADGERKSFSITRDVTVMGRREDCDFRIPLGDISRKHCRIIKEENVLKIEDLGSSNGTYVNGKRIHESDVQAGDTIQIGPCVFVTQIEGEPVDDDLKPYHPSEAKKKRPVDEDEDLAVMEEEDGESPTAQEHEPTEHSEHTEEAEPAATLQEDGDFDPMSVLEGNVDSDIMPALPDSAIREDIMLDMSDSRKPE